MRGGPREAGVTLMELMVSMTIFVVLGLFLFILTSRSLEIYRGAAGSAEYQDRWDRTLTTLAEDLRCAWPGDLDGAGEKGMLLASFDRRPPRPEGAGDEEADRRGPPLEAPAFARGDPRSFCVRLVRTLPGGELGDTVSRFAGTYAEQDAYIDGVDDEVESRARALADGVEIPAGEAGLKAPAGLMEVMWFLDRRPEDEAGSWTLFRAVRSPVGGPGSLLSDAVFDEMDAAWIAARATAVVSGLAALDLRFAGGEAGPDGGAAPYLETWDSTRGRVAAFPLHAGADSATRFDDDVFPARVMIRATFLSESRAAPDALLARPLEANARVVEVTAAGLFEDDEASDERHARVGEEWMRVEEVEDRTLRVRRGARGTVPSRHAAGAEVVVGRTFRRIVEVPARRPLLPPPGVKR